ncbi:MAG: nucleoside deaminase [Firmicutes bacterium]|nr:nucleoside deaminase [Bacillota bacterium]
MNELEQKAMNEAILESKANMENNFQKGGPFGAVIVKDGKIIASAHNTVVESMDATAHAEVNAIREASKILNTHDLSGCILFTSAEPCPMCLSAIIWANIKEVYYANTRKDTDDIGFRDDMIYECLKGNGNTFMKITHVESKEALEVFKKFKETLDKTMY